MIRALVERWRNEMSAIPSHLWWIAECDPEVLQTYLRWKRSLVTRGIPMVVICLLAAGLIKQAQILSVGNPLSFSLFAVCFGTLAWPPAYKSLGQAFWRGAAHPSAHSKKLRACSLVFFLMAIISTLCLTALTFVALGIWIHAKNP